MDNSLQELYSNRFNGKEIDRKNKLWREICAYLEKFIPANMECIVDVAAGYCDFINNIHVNCRKVAMDANPDVQKFAGGGIEAIVDVTNHISQYFEPESVDVFFMSNFLEHISKADISQLFETEWKFLKPKGEIWILTPNIRYVKGEYWDFFDHITPITEKALIEEARVHGFKVKKCIGKFLPFTTKSRLPQAAWLVRLYLRLMPISGWFFGKQSFLILKKDTLGGSK